MRTITANLSKHNVHQVWLLLSASTISGRQSQTGAHLQTGQFFDATSTANVGPGDSNCLGHIKECHGCFDARGVDVQRTACHCVSEALRVWEVLCLKALVPLVQGVVALLANRLIPSAQKSVSIWLAWCLQ